MSQQRLKMTPMNVTPLLARLVREKMVRGIVLPFTLPKEKDTFTEIIRYEKYYRIYFNNYQLGFNFILHNAVGLKEYAEKANLQDYNVDLDDPAAFAKYFPPMRLNKDEFKEVYRVRNVTVIRREQAALRVGCSENEIPALFPALKECAYCLFIDLTNPADLPDQD